MRDDDRPPVGSQLRDQLRWLAIAAVVLVALAFGAGWLFSTVSGPRAARSALAGRVEPVDEVTAAPAEPRCGVVDEPVGEDVVRATRAIGGVVVRYQPEAVSDTEVRELAASYRSHLLLAPDPDLESAVVATSSGHRLRLDEFDAGLLRTFAAGYGDPEGDPSTCPAEGPG